MLRKFLRTGRGQRKLAFVLAGFFLLSTQLTFAQSGGAKQTFPRIGGYYLAGKNYDDPDVQRDIAKLDVAYLGMFAFWNKGNNGSTTANQRAALQAIKSLNPDIRLFNYTNLQNARDNPDVIPFQDIYTKVDGERGPSGADQYWGSANNDWWLRKANGSYSDSNPYPSNRIVNPTSNVRPDSNGDRWPEWLAKRNADVMLDGIPEWDGIYTDTVKFHPLYTADYDGDGNDDQWDDPANWAMYRRPFRDYWDQLRVEVPGIMLTGNIGSWPFSERSGCRRCIGQPMSQGLPEFWQKLNGGLMEAVMGRTWSYEYWGTWQDMMSFYHRNMDAIIAPRLLLINIHLDLRSTETSGAIPQLQMMRYGFASVLMDNGYFSPSANAQYNDQQFVWFDEFDLAGTSNTDWMGLAVNPPQTQPWSKGVYRRDFQNAVALVNPKGNGTKTVTLEPGFRRIQGTQDPVVNNGNAVTSVTLKERDGIILVRVGGDVPEPLGPPDSDSGDAGDNDPTTNLGPPDADNGDAGDNDPTTNLGPPDADNGDNGDDDPTTYLGPPEVAPNPPVIRVI